MEVTVQISTCGMTSDNSIMELKKLKSDAFFGQLKQWKVLDVITEEFCSKPLLERMDTYELNDIVQFEQEIRGCGSIQCTSNSLLSKWSYTTHIRTSLFPHFYAYGKKKVSTNKLIEEIEKTIRHIHDSFEELGFDVKLVTVLIEIPSSNKSDADSVASLFQDTYRDEAGTSMLLKKMYEEVNTYIIINGKDNRTIDDIMLYKFWQVIESIHIIEKNGHTIVQGCREVSNRINSFEEKEFNVQTLNELANYKKTLLNSRRKYSNYREMINTMEAFRSYQLDNFFELLNSHKCNNEECLFHMKFFKRYENDKKLIERISCAAEQFIIDSETALATIDMMKQTLYNNNLQVRLKNLQIIAVVLAASALIVGIASLIVGIASLF